MKPAEGARRRINALDILRCVLISYYQDRYRVSPDAETMQKIITLVDVTICNITEEQARDMI